jgi:hypothetical protein
MTALLETPSALKSMIYIDGLLSITLAKENSTVDYLNELLISTSRSTFVRGSIKSRLTVSSMSVEELR